MAVRERDRCCQSRSAGVMTECVLVQFGYVKNMKKKVRSSDIQIHKLHQTPPIYYIVVDCYSEVI